MTLRILALAVVLTGVAAVADTPVFVGTINYKGGFAQDVRVALSPAVFVQSFELRVPSFCGDVEALEAKTVTEGIADPAGRAGKNVFTVNGTTGSRIGAILVTLNGPATPGCAIPVYVSNGTVLPPPTEITVQNYAVKRQEILRRIDKNARIAGEKGDREVLRILQDMEYNIIYRTPPQLFPGPQADEFVQTLRITQRTLERIEKHWGDSISDEDYAAFPSSDDSDS